MTLTRPLLKLAHTTARNTQADKMEAVLISGKSRRKPEKHEATNSARPPGTVFFCTRFQSFRTFSFSPDRY